MFNLSDPFGSLVDWVVDGAVESWKTTASWALGAGGMGENEWAVAFDLVNKVAGVMSFVAVALGAVGILTAAGRGKPGEMISAFFRTILAWPLTAAVVTLVAKAVAVSGSLTQKILTWAWPAKDSKPQLPTMDASKFRSIPGGTGVILFMALLIILGSVVLMLAMAARTVLIILGVGFAAIPVMSGAWSALRSSLRQYASWIVGVILFQPVCAVVVYLAGRLMESNGDSVTSYATGVVCMILASLFPWILVKVVARFLPGSEGLNVAAGGAAATVSTAKQAAATAVKVGTAAVSMGASAATGVAGGASKAASAGASSSSSASTGAGGMAGKAVKAFNSLANSGALGSMSGTARTAGQMLGSMAEKAEGSKDSKEAASARPVSAGAESGASASGQAASFAQAASGSSPVSAKPSVGGNEPGDPRPSSPQAFVQAGSGANPASGAETTTNMNVTVSGDTAGITVDKD
jgi:hypothetical protein